LLRVTDAAALLNTRTLNLVQWETSATWDLIQDPV